MSYEKLLIKAAEESALILNKSIEHLYQIHAGLGVQVTCLTENVFDEMQETKENETALNNLANAFSTISNFETDLYKEIQQLEIINQWLEASKN